LALTPDGEQSIRCERLSSPNRTRNIRRSTIRFQSLLDGYQAVYWRRATRLREPQVSQIQRNLPANTVEAPVIRAFCNEWSVLYHGATFRCLLFWSATISRIAMVMTHRGRITSSPWLLIADHELLWTVSRACGDWGLFFARRSRSGKISSNFGKFQRDINVGVVSNDA
jgi:hypothetical protein